MQCQNDKKNNYKVWGTMVADFDKKCPSAGRRCRRKFYNVTVFKEIVRSSSGKRWEAKKKMMWLNEWIEYAATTPARNLNEAEAKKLWASCLVSKEVPQDDGGPRGHHGVQIFMGDFEEVSRHIQTPETPKYIAQNSDRCKSKQKENEALLEVRQVQKSSLRGAIPEVAFQQNLHRYTCLAELPHLL